MTRLGFGTVYSELPRRGSHDSAAVVNSVSPATIAASQ
jgi:hypothetical protein